MELGEPDDSGRRRPVAVKGSEFLVECDLCIVAVGSGANPLLTSETTDMRLNKWGYIITDPQTGKTTKKGVWAGGDIVTGAATVILAMGAGRQAADSIQQLPDARLVIPPAQEVQKKEPGTSTACAERRSGLSYLFHNPLPFPPAHQSRTAMIPVSGCRRRILATRP